MRWWLLLTALVACNGDDPDTDIDTDVDTDVEDTDSEDTDVPVEVMWQDLTIETSTTLTGVYTGGTTVYVVGDDGSSWEVRDGDASVENTGVETNLTGVWGRGEGSSLDMVVVGYVGTVLEWTSTGFRTQSDPALGTTNFEDIDGNPDDLTAVSPTGIYRWDGEAWAFEDRGFNRSLRAIYVEDSGDAWVVGDDGTILRRAGGTWSQIPAPSGVDLRDVHGGGGEVFIAGNRGTFLQWDGEAFVDLDAPTNVNLSGVWVADSGVPYIVGSNGLAYKYDVNVTDPDPDDDEEPSPFVELATDSAANFYAIYGSSEDNVYAVGNRGALYLYTGAVVE